MMKLSVLILAIWLQSASCRRLTSRNHLSNDMNTNSNEINGRLVNSWVKISEAPEPEQQLRQGEALELECEASGSPAPVVQWYKGVTPLTDNEFMSNEINEYPPAQGLAKVRAKLRIATVSKQHEGTYVCEARSGNEVTTAATTLYVSGPKNFSQFLLNEKLLTPAKITYYYSIYMDNIGSDIELPCKADGNPRATIMWLDPSEQVIENGNDPRITVLSYGKLRIRNLRWNDMGPYTCVAKNLLSQDNVTTFLYPMLADK